MAAVRHLEFAPIIHTPCILPPLPPLKGFPLELGIGARDQKNYSGIPGRTRTLTISSAVWIQSTNMTDGRTDTGQQQRPRLRIASRR